MLRFRSPTKIWNSIVAQKSNRRTFKIGLFGDVHFQDKGLDKIEETAQWIIKTMKEQKVGAVVCLGDLLNTREQVSVVALHSCLQFLEQLRTTLQVPIHIVLGNHDMNLKHSHQISSLDVLTMQPLHPHFILHKQIQQVKLNDELPCLMIPYFENQKQFIQQYFEKEKKNWKEFVVFGHLELQGAIHQFHKDNQGNTFVKYISNEFQDKNKDIIQRTSTTANKKAVSNSTAAKKESLTTILSQCNKVFSGHLHHHHSLAKFPNIIYCGSPMQHHFGDSYDNQRGITIYDTIEDTASFIQNPKWDRFRILKFTQASQAKDFAQYCEQVLQNRNGKNEFEDKHFSIQMEHKLVNDPSTSVSFEHIQKLLFELGANEVKKQSLPFVSLPPVSQMIAQKGTPQNHQIDASKTWDSKTILESYMQQVFGFLDNNWKEVLLKKGKEIVESVKHNSSFIDQISQGTTFEANIKTITLENFLGVQETIQIDISKMSDGIWLLQGANGTGKSTILEAISWCLFDECLRSDMKADFVINDAVKKNCMVKIEFENGYVVERFRKYSEKDGVVTDTTGKEVPVKKGNGFRVFKDGVYLQNYEKGSLGASQKAFQRDILKTTFEIFSKSVVLGDNLINFVTSKDKTRRELIEEILGMNQIEDLLAESRKLLKGANQKKTDLSKDLTLLQNELFKFNLDYKRVEEEMKKLEESKQQYLEYSTRLKNGLGLVEFRRKQEDTLQYLRTLEVKWRQYQQEIQLIKIEERRVDDYLSQQNNISKKLEQKVPIQNQLQQLEQRYKELDAMCSEKSKLIYTIDQENNYALAHLESNSNELRRLKMLLDKNQCPFCLQGISAHKHEEMEVHVNELEQKCTELKKTRDLNAVRKSDEQQKLDNDTMKRNSILNQIQILKQKMQEILAEENRLEQINLAIQKSNALINNKQSLLLSIWSESRTFYDIQSEKMSNLQSEELEFKKQEYAAVMDIKLADKLIEEKKNQIANLSEKKVKIQNSISLIESELSSLDQQLGALEFWEAAFSTYATKFTGVAVNNTKLKDQYFKSVRQYILDQSIKEINLILKEYSSYLDQSLDINLDSNLQISEDYGKRSAGQRKRNHLVIFFALFDLVRQRSSFRANFMALDEVFDSLDLKGQGQVLQLLDLMSQKVNKVFVVSHSTHLIEGVKKRIVAEMTPKGTQYSIFA